MNFDGGYVQAGIILIINLGALAAGGGAVAATVRGLTSRVQHIEDRVDRIYDLLVERKLK